MLNQKRYSGIGSRQTPPAILDRMTRIASFLEKQEYILYSGGAKGADSAFEKGVSDQDMKKIFLPWKGFNGKKSSLCHISSAAVTLAEQFHPQWLSLSPSAKKLMIRNGYQVLGEALDTPVDMVVCYTPHGKIEGGTGQALRIAKHFKIPVFNLYYNKDIDWILSWMDTGTICLGKDMELESWRLM
jgi:hypothetical protein